MTPPLALIVLFGFGAVCAVAGALWAARRRDEALREARVARQQLLEIADHCIWETDASHALLSWRPPATRAEAGAWCQAVPRGEPLWRLALLQVRLPPAGAPRSDTPPPGMPDTPGGTPSAPEPTLALRRLMDAHAPLDDLRVTFTVDGHRTTWRLRGVPRLGRDGRFEGYLGHARPVDDTESAAFSQAALARVCRLSEDALLVFRRAAPGQPWTLQRASDEARALLAERAPTLLADDPGGPDWTSACDALPPPVGAALKGLRAGEPAVVDGWQVGWTRIASADDEDAGRLLSLRRVAHEPVAVSAPAPVAEPAPAPAETPDSAADHESFIYSVSHDLRAPIRVVEGFARILKEDYGRALDRIGNDHTERILAAAARMNHMIDALLALSRLQSQPLKRQPVDLSQLAAWIVEDLRGEQPDRQVEVSIEPGIVVQGDPTLLRNAMENLVGNAWKYTSRNPAARIVFRREERDGRTLLVVEDNGAGFDMRFADRLFGVFQRLHSAKDFHGTGVGLASVKRILRRHGGDIWAESEVGKGARFFFTLP